MAAPDPASLSASLLPLKLVLLMLRAIGPSGFFSCIYCRTHTCAFLKNTMLHGITEKELFKNTDNQKLGQVTGAVHCYLLATHDAVVTEMKYLRAHVLPL